MGLCQARTELGEEAVLRSAASVGPCQEYWEPLLSLWVHLEVSHDSAGQSLRLTVCSGSSSLFELRHASSK